jgi:hypothetical protein
VLGLEIVKRMPRVPVGLELVPSRQFIQDGLNIFRRRVLVVCAEKPQQRALDVLGSINNEFSSVAAMTTRRNSPILLFKNHIERRVQPRS